MDICEGSLNVFSGWGTTINILAMQQYLALNIHNMFYGRVICRAIKKIKEMLHIQSTDFFLMYMDKFSLFSKLLLP